MKKREEKLTLAIFLDGYHKTLSSFSESEIFESLNQEFELLALLYKPFLALLVDWISELKSHSWTRMMNSKNFKNIHYKGSFYIFVAKLLEAHRIIGISRT